MKKIYAMLLVGAVVSSSIYAQEASPVNSNGALQVTPSHQPLNPKYTPKNTSNRGVTESFWLNYAEAQDKNYGGNSQSALNYLLNDSLPFAAFSGNTYSHPWVHFLGDILDVTAQNWSVGSYSSIAWDDKQAFTVDSMGMQYLYTRHKANVNIVDTILVYLYTNNTAAANIVTRRFNPPYAQNFIGGSATDTVWFDQQYYDNVNHLPKSQTGAISGLTVIKVPLTKTDTADWYWGYKEWQVPSNFIVNAGKLVATAITFKPGYISTIIDTLGVNANSFHFRSFEENGSSTYMNFNSCVRPQATCDWNGSSIVRSQERYNYGSWKGAFVPAWAFTIGYGFEHHSIYYKVTSNFVGIDEHASASNIASLSNSPNPSNGNTVIDYKLVNTSDVLISIYDATGKKVMEVNDGKQSAGKHSVNINASSLSAGVYYYTLTAGENTLTKKMVIVE